MLAGLVELRNSVATVFDMALPATATFDHPSVAALAAFIAGRLAPAVEEKPETFAAESAHEILVHTAHFSAEDVLRRLKVQHLLQPPRPVRNWWRPDKLPPLHNFAGFSTGPKLT